jgi:VanZ family protein
MEWLVIWIRKYWILSSLALFITIAILSFSPIILLSTSDKMLHVLAYSVLVLPLMLKKPRYWLAVLIGYGLWSGAIELVQPYANHRTDIMDVLANIAGLFIGSLFAAIINYYVPEQ